ncbi:MAG TPA: TetR/AcrR family transcriptional regulator [Candidatus Methylomirabilis sp.]|jgi:AcrR family transcriptional regulator
MTERLKAAERREQIVQAAVELFSRKGFRGTTTREIAEAVGISEAALFKYFATKEDLYTAIIEAKAQTDEVIATASPAAARRDDAGVFRAVGLHFLEEVQRDTSLMRLLLFSALEGHELSEMFFRSRVRRLHEFLADYIRAGAAAGRFRPLDPLLAARAFLGMVFHNLLIHELFGVKREPTQGVHEVVDALVALFLRGLETGGRREAAR